LEQQSEDVERKTMRYRTCIELDNQYYRLCRVPNPRYGELIAWREDQGDWWLCEVHAYWAIQKRLWYIPEEVIERLENRTREYRARWLCWVIRTTSSSEALPRNLPETFATIPDKASRLLIRRAQDPHYRRQADETAGDEFEVYDKRTELMEIGE
jgi:hypothetical protein